MGAKYFQVISWKACSFHQALPNHLCHFGDAGHLITNAPFSFGSFFQNDWGCTPTPMGRTGYHSQVSIGLERNSFKAIHLAPTKFSANSQSTNDAEASQPHQHGSAHPALRKVRSRLQRTSLIQKREELQNSSDTDEDQRAFVVPHSNDSFLRPQMTTGSKQAMITLLHSFFNFLFNRALHWSVQKLN